MSSRFIYRANALAVGGRMTEPAPTDIPLQAPLVLPVAGGGDTAERNDFRFGELLSFRHAATRVAGGPLARGGWGTISEAVVEGLSILGGRLTVERMVARLTSFHPPEREGPHEPHISTEGTSFTGLRIDGEIVKFDSHVERFAALGRFTALRQAFGADRAFAAAANRDFLWNGNVTPDAPEALQALARSCREQIHENKSMAPVLRGLVPCSVVGNVRCGGRLRVWGTWIGVPGLGRVQLGELLVGAESRRLTMLRVELDTDYVPPPARTSQKIVASAQRAVRAVRSGEGDDGELPQAGEMSAGSIETNGSPHP